MQLCISYWSVQDGLSNTRPIEEAIVEAKQAGFDKESETGRDLATRAAIR